MLAAAFAVLFGLSLLPGRKPLCLKFAERVSDGIMPDGAAAYCRALTWVWFAVLLAIACSNAALLLCGAPWWWTLATAAAVPLTFIVEKSVRDRRFRVVFRTSGSTGGAKTIVKTYESLAREVAFHRAFYRRSGIVGASDRPLFLATIDPSHMYGTLWRVMLPKACGCECDPEVILTPESLLAKMRSAGRVFLVTTPSFLDRFTAYAGQYDIPQNCVEIVTSGALLEKEVSERAMSVFGVEPRQIFGSTETGGVAWRRGNGRWEVFDAVRTRAVGGRLAVRSPYSFRRGWYVMGDGVELSKDGRSFRLLGRMDRLVKINEERVNLAEMEARVRGLGFADCALAAVQGERGPCIGCVIAAPGPLRAIDLRKRLLPVFPKGTVPKRYRVVRELPRNAQGKVVASEIVRMLESALVEPQAEDVSVTDSAFSATYVFDASAPYFQGHFPSLPIMPGVAQLGFAERAAESIARRPLTLKCVRKMKFMHVIEPGERVRLQVERREGGEYAYEFRKGETVCSSGILVAADA
ncbi:MAG: acyl-CoA synthetase [Kiritimatiellae bacterium]|nr:acyl-CoA synthetase [Kiritimatiellia bacterium]